jgi:ABC-type multidrug transport system ATPase subunit
MLARGRFGDKAANRLRRLGRAVLLISHRFSSVRSADRIYVLHKGQLIEQGTHADLMLLNGQYAELFNLHAAAYQQPVARPHGTPGDLARFSTDGGGRPIPRRLVLR